MNTPTFIINEKAPKRTSEAFRLVFNPDVLKQIYKTLTDDTAFSTKWIADRINYGRLAILKTTAKKFYITISSSDPQRGRDSYFQSVPTAFQQFLNDADDADEFVVVTQSPANGHLTDYQQLVVRMLRTAQIRVVDISPSQVLERLDLQPFTSISSLISERNKSKKRNRGNQSTFITDEGPAYHLYGKTFGANGKETAMFCYALMGISDKPVRLFQILDNGATAISSNDINSIAAYSLRFGKKAISVLDDKCDFDDSALHVYRPTDKLQLRTPRFIYNLLQKTNGQKQCALCHCDVSPIIQAAHIYGVAEIRKNTNLTDDQKENYATDADNGIWLCMHHHKLFDEHQIELTPEISLVHCKGAYKTFVRDSIKVSELDSTYLNPQTIEYFKLKNNS